MRLVSHSLTFYTIAINLNSNGLYIEADVTINDYGAGQDETSVILHHSATQHVKSLNYST